MDLQPSTQQQAKPRYYSPSRYVEVEVSLDDFSDEQVAQEHAHRSGQAVSTYDGTSLLIVGEDLARLQTLTLCGQRQAALDFLLTELERQTGVKL